MRNKIVSRANEIVGKSRDDIDCSGSYAWCAATVSKVLEYCGIAGVSSLSCNSMYKLMTKSSEWDEPENYPIPADVIFFDWNDPNNPDADEATLPLDHVGIVVEFDESTGLITYVNGNGNSSTHVTKQTISVHNRCVSYWMRYVGPGTNDVSEATTEANMDINVSMPVIKTGNTGNAVKTLQVLLSSKFGYELPKYGCDSDFGAETNSALRKFQKDKGLTVDGICGLNTWTAILN